MGRLPRWHRVVDVARQEAALAVRLYNDPAEVRGLEGFIIHMNLAWLYLLHAEFTRDGVDFRYRDPKHPRRLMRVGDGSSPNGAQEVKCWELSRCLKERWEDCNDPVRRNVDFFIVLRNRIEHRHPEAHESLELVISGKSQALLLNFEEEVMREFGVSRSLAHTLRFPVFVGTFTPEGQEALVRLQSKLPTELRKFIAVFDAGLPDEIRQDHRYEFRPRVILEKGARGPDSLVMQFTRPEDMTDAELAAAEELGKRGQAIVIEKIKPVVGADLFRPQEVVDSVKKSIPFDFNMSHATAAWKIGSIRPESGSAHPERTLEQYSLYSKLSRSYGYTQALISRLVEKCQTPEGFRAMTGRDPVPKKG